MLDQTILNYKNYTFFNTSSNELINIIIHFCERSDVPSLVIIGINDGAILSLNICASTLDVINNKFGKTYGCNWSDLAS